MLVARWWFVNNWMHFKTFAHISNCWNDDTQMGWQVQSWWQVHGCSTAAHFSVLWPGRCKSVGCIIIRRFPAVSILHHIGDEMGWGCEDCESEWHQAATCLTRVAATKSWELCSSVSTIYISTYLHIYTLGAELGASVHNILWITAEICHIKQWHSHLKCSQFRQTHSTTELCRSVSR